MKKPAILFLVNQIPPVYSGAGQRASRHANYIYNEGHLFKLVINCNYDSQTNSIPKENVFQVILPDWLRNNPINYLFFNISVLFFLFRNKSKFDIIHSYIDTYNCIGAILFSKIAKKKIIVEFTLLPGFSINRKRWPAGEIRKYILNNCSLVICKSLALSDWCKMNLKNKSAIKIIANDTDLVPPEIDNLSIKNQYKRYRKLILCAGPQISRKGFDIAIESFKILKREFPELGLIWLGPQKETICIKDKKVRIGDLTPVDFILIGKVKNILDYYRIADVTLFPSRQEGFGNVIIESMASGTPVVASLLEGVTDSIIHDGKDGILIAGENPVKYAEEIKKLFLDQDYYNMIREGAFKTIENNFRSNLIMSFYWQVYSNLCI